MNWPSKFTLAQTSSPVFGSHSTTRNNVFSHEVAIAAGCNQANKLRSHSCPLTARRNSNKLCGRPPQYAPVPCKLTFDLLTLKVVAESRVTWATAVPFLVFLALSVLDLGPMYATDRQIDVRRQTDVRRASSLNAFTLWGRGIITCTSISLTGN